MKVIRIDGKRVEGVNWFRGPVNSETVFISSSGLVEDGVVRPIKHFDCLLDDKVFRVVVRSVELLVISRFGEDVVEIEYSMIADTEHIDESETYIDNIQEI